MKSGAHTLGKTERLGERKILEDLFLNGEKIHTPGLTLRWKKDEKLSTVQAKAAFSVPKRLFKKAVDRNLLKRRMRESYRKNKPFRIPEAGEYDKIYYFLFTYTAHKINSYREIESKIVLTLQHLKNVTENVK